MKTKIRVFEIFLCFALFAFVGCDTIDGGPWGGNEVVAMDGVKVLAKPATYDIKDSLGGYSENFYNLFAREVTKCLYQTYQNQVVDQGANVIFDNIKQSDEDVLTFGDFVGDKESLKYYLYDSLRYTIKEVSTKSDNVGVIEFKVVLNTATKWNWSISGINTAFKNTLNTETSTQDIEITIQLPSSPVYNDFEQYLASLSSDFPDMFGFYSAKDDEQVNNEKDEDYADYFFSPYYGTNGKKNEMQNYFQDALEYATYMFVLGFDLEKDAQYFDMDVVFNADKTAVEDITVKGWQGDTAISISKGENCALANAKDMYAKVGNYVGLTDANKAQIVKFIEKKVLGDAAMKDDGKFEITKTNFDQNGFKTGETTLRFDRNYHQIISNIVDYASTKAPIGVDENGILTMDGDPYLMSTITDYVGNYFGPAHDDNSDDDLYKYVEAAEYQSMVIFPNSKEFEEYYDQHGEYPTIGDISVKIEYFGPEVAGKTFADSISMTVGVRMFDHVSGTFKGQAEIEKIIDYGKTPTYQNMDQWEEVESMHTASFSDTGTGADKEFGEGVELKTTFNNAIGNNAINPFAPVNVGNLIQFVPGQKATMAIKASTKAKDFYQLTETESGDTFGCLNEKMFVGEGACDYIEIYFVVHKIDPNTNYNFKVVLDSFALNDYPGNL